MGIPIRRRSASELQFDEGDRVGPYQVIRRVAPSCYDAEAVDSGAPVRIELASDADAALIDIRFTRAQAQLSLVVHPLIAQIIDHGVLANGRPWVASERPAGTALSDVLSQRRLEPRECTALIYSVAQVLAFAHHRQVVHGSLRPHHLTLSRGAKVSISGWAWLRSPGIPSFGDPANTSVYNPPEHDGQSPIDGRADVYALGAIAYRALTGVFPDVSRDLLDPREPLGAAIENMLSLDARDRNSAAAIVADLHEQRLADRAANKERASTSSIEGRPPTSPVGVRPPTNPFDVRPPTNPITSDTDEERLARAEKEIEELRAKRPSSPPPRASSPRIESSSSLRELAQEVLARASSPRLDEPAGAREERPSDRMTAVHGAMDIEQRRTRPMSAAPSRGLETPAPSPVAPRTTRPMSTVEYSALDTDDSPAIERARRFVSIQSALHDLDEPQTDRVSARAPDQELTDVSPQELDDTDLAPSIGAQDPTDRTSL